MEIERQTEKLIGDRYRIVQALGHGGTGTTYEAEDLQTHRRVAVKALSLRQMKDWKVLELLEREAKVLQNLDHPAIPKYLDYIRADDRENRHFYLVQELVEGDSLADKMAKRWRPKEAQVKAIAFQILEILQYLHGLRPPVIHRDIKPENILMQPDGKVFLIDFGAVQDVYRNTFTREGSFVGTLGYMPPEQFRGKALPATDLYALGATLLFLLTGKSPEEFPYHNLRIDFGDRVKVSPAFSECLRTLLEPAVEDRFQQPEDVLKTFKEEPIDREYLAPKYRQPKDSTVVVKRTENRLVIEISPRRSPLRILMLILFGGFALRFIYVLAEMAIVGLFVELSQTNWEKLLQGLSELAKQVIETVLVFPFAALFFCVFLFVFLTLLGLLFNAACNRFIMFFLKERLEFDRDSFRILWQFLGGKRQVRGEILDIEL